MRHIPLTDAALNQVLGEWSLPPGEGGLLALLPEAEKDQLPRLQAACRQHGLALAGAIFPALIVGQRFVTHGVWLLPQRKMPAHFLIPALNAPDGSAVGRVVEAVRTGLTVKGAGEAKPTLYMFFDGMVPNVASLLDGVYLELANRVEYAGVNAGSESFQPMPCLFDANRLVGDGVLGLLLPNTAAPALAHGFVQPERAMSATATEGNRIASIDWRPAFEVYQEVIKAQFGIELTRDNFYEFAVHFPLGMVRASGDVVVRIPVALTDDGALYCVGEIPENAMLVLLQAPPAGGNACLEQLAGDLRQAHGAQPGGRLLTFYCAGRRMHLGSAAESELADLHAATGCGEMAGALSLGEIGSTVRGGYPMFHNATLVCSPWGDA